MHIQQQQKMYPVKSRERRLSSSFLTLKSLTPEIISKLCQNKLIHIGMQDLTTLPVFRREEISCWNQPSRVQICDPTSEHSDYSTFRWYGLCMTSDVIVRSWKTMACGLGSVESMRPRGLKANILSAGPLWSWKRIWIRKFVQYWCTNSLFLVNCATKRCCLLAGEYTCLHKYVKISKTDMIGKHFFFFLL